MRSLAFILVWLLGSVAAHAQGFGQSLPFLAKDASGTPEMPFTYSGLKLWLYFEPENLTNASNANPSDGDGIKDIKDLSGNNYTLRVTNDIPNTGSLQFNSSGGPDGNPYVRWMGIESQRATNAAATFSQPNTAFFVWKPQENSWSSMVELSSYSLAAINQFAWTTATGPSPKLAIGIHGGTDLGGANLSFLLTNIWNITTVQWNGANSLVRTNGVLYMSGDAGSQAMSGFIFGNYASATTGWSIYSKGSYAEVLFYNNGLTSNQIYAVESWLSARHNITIP